jgi:hypothetical protein
MSELTALRGTDREIHDLIRLETKRQAEFIRLIPSENYASSAVMEATGSILNNKYSEGYPGRRYYEGQEYIDQVETLAIERAKALFGVEHANVQPYSGSPANQAVYLALVKPGETVMGLGLPFGGHLTHGWGVNFGHSVRGGAVRRRSRDRRPESRRGPRSRAAEGLRRHSHPRTWDYALRGDRARGWRDARRHRAHRGLIVAGAHRTGIRTRRSSPRPRTALRAARRMRCPTRAREGSRLVRCSRA